ncbi:MAG: TonB-dependent receptor [Deltaproteobacteria bacterium]|nr:MAG: TonB-dependent receptor [Deltaproteobacteria bacterium]
MKYPIIGLSMLFFLLPQETVLGQENQTSQLDTITVTAQKQEENVQEVPVSISLLDEYAIEDNNIRTISDIGLFIPNLQQFSVGGMGAYTPGIRGLSADPHTFHSSVATYMDGIPYLSSIGNDLILEDIERIEVLRGPQGTLYGKNAYSGVINIISRQPDNNFRGKVKAELGEDNKQQYTANISGPLVKDKFYASLSATHYEKDGFVQNIYLHRKDDDRKDNAVKLHLRYQPDSNLSVSLISNYMKKDDGAYTIESLSAPDPRITHSNFAGYTKSKSLSSALKIDYAWDEIAFTSVSTYKQYDDIRGFDFDYSPANGYHAIVDSKYKDYSEEFRLNGQTGRLNWLTGIYLDKNDEKPFNTNKDMPTTKSKTENKGLGIFANFDYGLNDKLILTSGIRYDMDDIGTEDYLQGYKDEKSYNEISPKFGVKYIQSQNTLYYAIISKGYKRGGFYFPAPPEKRGYDPETLWNYEIGFKDRIFNNKLLFNISAFYMDITDMQVLAVLSQESGYISNAAKATSKGLELETAYRIFKPLELFINIGLAETKFETFSDTQGDYSGNDNPFAPAYNYSAGFIYRDTRGIFAQFNINGQDAFYTDKANTFKSDSYTHCCLINFHMISNK